MTRIDDHGRPEPPEAGNETDTLLGFLDYQRATLAWKCEGLDAAGMRTTTAASTMTVGGLLKHMALVEDHWFSRWLDNRAPAAPWDTVDWDADPDWEWHSAADDTPDALRQIWPSMGPLYKGYQRSFGEAASIQMQINILEITIAADGASATVRTEVTQEFAVKGTKPRVVKDQTIFHMVKSNGNWVVDKRQ